MEDILNALQQILKVSQKASDTLLRYYNQTDALDVSQKQDNSPVTEADLASDKILKEGLLNSLKDAIYFSEETQNTPPRHDSAGEKYWLVDPLDGTKGFIKHNGEFCISIALMQNKQPIFGLITCPMQKTHYYAIKNNGSWTVDFDSLEPAKKIKARIEMKQPHLIVSNAFGDEQNKKVQSKIGDFTTEKLGSALKFCRIAEGKADFYIRFAGSCEWDIAAGHLIIEEAGGTLCQHDGSAIVYGKDNLLNPKFAVFSDAQLAAKMGIVAKE